MYNTIVLKNSTTKKKGGVELLKMNMVLWRSLLGLSQKELADKLNISQQAYSRKEKGITEFSDNEKVIIKDLISVYFPEVSIDVIFFNETVLNFSTK